MARQTSKSKPRKRTSAEEGKGAGKRRLTRGPRVRGADASRILDDRRRRDIIAVVLILIAVVLLLVVLLSHRPENSNALITGYAGEGLHYAFGVGCYLFPFFLAAFGATFLVRPERGRASMRTAIGLVVVFVPLLGFISLFTPISNLGTDSPPLLFDRQMVYSYGGYIGAAIAWCGLMLFGRVITRVILVGIMLVGVIIIGFSVSRLIEKVSDARPLRDADHEEGESSEAAPLFARIRLRRSRRAPEAARPRRDEPARDAAPVRDASAAETNVLVKPARPLSATPTTRMPVPGGGRSNKRHRRSRDLDDVSSVARTRRIDDANPAERLARPAADRRDAAFGGDPGQPAAPAGLQMTRRLGRRDEEDEGEGAVEDDGAARPASPRRQADAIGSPIAEPDPQEGFVLPPFSLLAAPAEDAQSKTSKAELDETADRLQETLEQFGIMAKVVDGIPGPTVTLFLVDLPPGVRVSRVTALNDDIALALAAPGVRIFAPVPKTNYVGIEVPNRTRQTVFLSDVLATVDDRGGPLQIAIGKDVEGHSIVSDLAKMPHLLIGGTTGSGKSVAINAMIMSILMRATPSEVRFILVDPKRVEFTPYNGIPHLYVPVVTEAREAASALSWGVAEMERRLKVFSNAGARNIGQFNAKVKQAREAEEKAREQGAEVEPWEHGEEMPYIVIIIDELADLMMNVGKEVEFSISRIAQLARAAGIHLIVATQRPSANVVTGLIKANITNRIAFNVATGIDSRVILDTPGAENLIGLGDMLFVKPEYDRPRRIQGCYVSEDEINAVVSTIKEQGEPEYHSEILSTNIAAVASSSPDASDGGGSDDPLVWDAAEIVVSSDIGSTSNIQRRLKVGYSRAGRIMDQLEEKGIVGPANGSKPRDVLVDDMELETLKAFEANDEATASGLEE